MLLRLSVSGSTEASNVWQKFIDSSDSPVSAFVPDFGLTQKTVTGPTTAEYHFTFTNECVAVVVFSTVTEEAELNSHSCPTDECADDSEMAQQIGSSLQITDPRFAACISTK